jgi:signal transduction histidine kinase
LERVLPNLAVNARDAMPEGGIPAVETSPVTLDGAYSERKIDVEPGEYAMMSVSDSGHGMDEALRGLPDKVAAVLGKEKV